MRYATARLSGQIPQIREANRNIDTMLTNRRQASQHRHGIPHTLNLRRGKTRDTTVANRLRASQRRLKIHEEAPMSVRWDADNAQTCWFILPCFTTLLQLRRLLYGRMTKWLRMINDAIQKYVWRNYEESQKKPSTRIADAKPRLESGTLIQHEVRLHKNFSGKRTAPPPFYIISHLPSHSIRNL